MNHMPVSAPVASSTDPIALQREILRLKEQLHRAERERDYSVLQRRIAEFIHCAIPRGSTVLVISKGDEALLDIAGRRAWHFPRAINGMYAGCYPADSQEAISHLRRLESEGAEYLVIPSTSFWWLEFYPGLARHLRKRRRLVAYHEGVCLVFRLQSEYREQAANRELHSNSLLNTAREMAVQ
jgi:hypothetical protein